MTGVQTLFPRPRIELDELFTVSYLSVFTLFSV